MKTPVRTLSIAGSAVLSSGAAVWAAKLLVDAGTFDRVWMHHPAMDCVIHKGLPGVEDLVRITGTDRVLATSRKRVLRDGEKFNSGLYMYDVGTPAVAPSAIALPDAPPFAPHGLGYLADAADTPESTDSSDAVESAEGDGKARAPSANAHARGYLHVVNHGDPEGDSVEQFRVDGDNVTHLRGRTFPGVRTMNAVQPLGDDAFYFTTDFGSSSPFAQVFEKFLRIPRGGVFFSSGKKARQVAGRLLFANGLTLSPDGKSLYVAEMLARRIHVYAIDSSTHALRETRNLFIDTAPDNLRFDAKGRLYVAAHPRLLDLDAHSKAPWKTRSPSQVIRVSSVSGVAGAEGEAEMEEILSDPGTSLSAVSTALPVGDHLLMGTIYSDGLYDCRLKNAD